MTLDETYPLVRGLIWIAAPNIIAKAQKKKNDAKPERMNIKIKYQQIMETDLTIASNHAL